MTDTIESLRAALARVTAERDEARQWVEDYKADHRAVVEGRCAADERHCSCVPHLRRALAAAPEMLEALDAALVYLTMGGTDHAEPTRAVLRAAIKKARGH